MPTSVATTPRRWGDGPASEEYPDAGHTPLARPPRHDRTAWPPSWSGRVSAESIAGPHPTGDRDRAAATPRPPWLLTARASRSSTCFLGAAEPRPSRQPPTAPTLFLAGRFLAVGQLVVRRPPPCRAYSLLGAGTRPRPGRNRKLLAALSMTVATASVRAYAQGTGIPARRGRARGRAVVRASAASIALPLQPRPVRPRSGRSGSGRSCSHSDAHSRIRGRVGLCSRPGRQPRLRAGSSRIAMLAWALGARRGRRLGARRLPARGR